MIGPTRTVAGQQRAAWPARTSASYLDAVAADAPERLAVVEGDVSLTYGQLHRAAQELAAGLAGAGVGRGDVVLVQLPNWWEATVVYQALMRLGAICCPVVTIYRQRELAFIIDQARPKAVIAPHEFRGFDHAAMFAGLVDDDTRTIAVRPGSPTSTWTTELGALMVPGAQVADAASPDDVCMLMYTSGTTSEPKGVIHNHRTLVYENQTIVQLGGLTAEDTVFMPSPVTHITGLLYGLLLPPMLGAGVALLDVWDPARAVEVIEQNRARFTVGATPFLQGLADAYEERGAASALRLFLCGGAGVPPDLVRRAGEVMGTVVARVYGSTEFPTYSSGGPGDDLDLRAGTDGRPLAGAEGRLAEVAGGVGELEVRGPELFLGYLDAALNETAFTRDGWFRTGDLASIDERGAVTIRGRSKDIIVRGGENISAREVEDLLYTHPDIVEVAVVAMPDPVMVEKACAFVVPRVGASPDVATLATHLETFGIARQKYPERVELVDELPKTASGKVQKYVLRQRVAALLED